MLCYSCVGNHFLSGWTMNIYWAHYGSLFGQGFSEMFDRCSRIRRLFYLRDGGERCGGAKGTERE